MARCLGIVTASYFICLRERWWWCCEGDVGICTSQFEISLLWFYDCLIHLVTTCVVLNGQDSQVSHWIGMLGCPWCGLYYGTSIFADIEFYSRRISGSGYRSFKEMEPDFSWTSVKRTVTFIMCILRIGVALWVLVWLLCFLVSLG